MPGFSPNYSIPYQTLAEPPHGPNLGQDSALVVDAALTAMDARVDALEALARYTRINESVLTGTAASVSFTSIPATYRALQLHAVCRGDVAAQFTPVNMRFNNDSTAVYNYVNFQGSGTGTAAAETLSATSAYCGDMPGATTVAGSVASYVITIPWYGTTFWKQATTQQVSTLQTSGGAANLLFTKLLAGMWRSTAAITRVDLLAGSGNFIAGSSFALFGLP